MEGGVGEVARLVTASNQVSVDGDRLRRHIETNGQFGSVSTTEGLGRTVLPGTESNRLAREYLVDRMVEAGLAVDVDAVGNITGTWTPPECDPDAAPVAAGSHLDSVPFGGIFDGPLGVYAALNAVRAIQEARLSIDRPVQVVCFTGEEGTRFADGLLGSSVATGKLDPEAALARTDEGETLREALDEIGFHGTSLLDASAWHAWLELHVEQSSRLERLDVPVGVVTSIAGARRLRVTIEGHADHAGTTSMADRTDALAAASELVSVVEREAETIVADTSETAVATVGELEVTPGVPNVIPGTATLGIDLRDTDTASIDRLTDRVRTTLDELESRRGVTTSLDKTYDVPPTELSPVCRDTLHAAGATVGADSVDLHSGAGHDTMHVADVTDAGLLFAPSEGGHSHSGLEWTPWGSCTAAAEVLATALADLAGVHARKTPRP